MNVFINNTPKEFTKPLLISEILPELKLNAKGVAIAINNEVIPKLNWDHHTLKENDKVTIIRATQGG